MVMQDTTIFLVPVMQIITVESTCNRNASLKIDNNYREEVP
jgi:hypothetical protein